MKRIPILLALLVIALTACPSEPTITGVSVTSVPAATGGLLGLLLSQSVTVKASVTGTGAFNAAVQWSLSPNDGSLTSSGNTATLTPKAVTTYTLTAISQADTSRRASLIVNVTVPDVLVIASPTDINPSQPSSLTASVKDIGGAVAWSVDPTTGTSFTPPTPGNATNFTSSQPGIYTITATSVTNPNLKGTVTVRVSSVTAVTLNAAPGVLGIGQTSGLTSSVEGQNSPSSAVTWSVTPTTGATLTPNGSSASFSASATGKFTVTATSVQDATKSASTVILVPWTGSKLIGSGGGDTITGSATDADGNIYVSGFTTGALQGSNQGQIDAFLAKFDVSGTQVWVRQLGSSKDDLAYGVAVDAGGNVYVAGTTSGTMPDAPSSAGNDDAFVVKYDANGARLWVSQFGTSGFENAFGVAVGADGSVYVAGDTDASLGATNPDVGNTDAFVTKLDPSTGARTWTKQLGVVGNDTAYGIAVDGNGNVDIAGSTEGTLGNVSSLGRDAFIAQYSPAGTLTWVRQFGSSNSDEIKDLAVDTSGNVFVVGQTDGNLSGSNAGLGDAFVAKYSQLGTQVWLKQFGSSADDAASGISVDVSGNAYVSGQTDGSLPGNSNAGGTDAFLTKFDPSGARQWIKQIGTSSTDVGFAASVADNGSSAVLVGYTEGNPFDGLTGAGGREGFIAKYKPDGSH